MAEAVGEKLASTVGDTGDKTWSQAQEQVHTGKDRAAEGVEHATDAMRDAAERLHEQEPWLAELISTGTDELGQLAETLRSNDLRSMLRRTEDLSRRQPMLVAGAAFAAGFAAIRMVRAGTSSASSALSDVAGNAMATAQREAKHAMAAAQQTVKEAGGDRPEPQQQQRGDRREAAGGEAGRTDLGQR